MWIAYRGQVAKGACLTGFEFTNKDDVLRILQLFPQAANNENWRISDISKDGWQFYKEDFFAEFIQQLAEIKDDRLQHTLPSVMSGIVEELPVGNEGEFPVIWRDLLGQLGYQVNSPDNCIHRRIELIKKGRYTSQLTFRCLDCDERLTTTGDTCQDCGGVLDTVKVEEVQVSHRRVVGVGLMPSSVAVKEKSSPGSKFSSKCRNCGKEGAYVIS